MISQRKVALTLLIFYVFAAVAYGLTLELTSRWEAEQVPQRMLLDYGLKALVSLPLVYLVFGVMRRRRETEQLFVTALLALPFAFAWQLSYYAVGDLVGVGHMGPVGRWWDIYIPTLVYCIQFLILFAAQYHNRTLAATQRAERLAALAQASELAALKAQVNPHFLFNTLNAISASLPPEREDTRELMGRLADLFRYQVIASQSETVPLRRELDFVRDYLTLARARMGARLTYDIELAEGVPHEAPVLPMLLQPIVENAVKHGLSPKLSGGHVVVQVGRVGDRLRVEVEDDGVGLGASGASGTGVGLANTRRRLELTYGTELQLVDRAGGGTRVLFDVPIAPTAGTPSASLVSPRPDRAPTAAPAVALTTA